MYRFRSALVAVLSLAVLVIGIGSPAPADATSQAIAVLAFDSSASSVSTGMDPGRALADYVGGDLVNAGGIAVISPAHVTAVQQAMGGAQQDPVALGKALGARYIVTGRIVEFTQTATHQGGLNGLFGQLSGNVGGTVDSAHLELLVQIVDTATGVITRSFTVPGDTSQTSLNLGVNPYGKNVSTSTESSFTAKLDGLLHSVAGKAAGMVTSAVAGQ